MKIERPRLGGCVFVVRPSYVVRRGDRFFRVPCFKTGIAGLRPASRKKVLDTVANIAMQMMLLEDLTFCSNLQCIP